MPTSPRKAVSRCSATPESPLCSPFTCRRPSEPRPRMPGLRDGTPRRDSDTLLGDVAPGSARGGTPPDREERKTGRLTGGRRVRVNHSDGDAEIAARRDDDPVRRPRQRAAGRRLTGGHHASNVLRAHDEVRVGAAAQVDGGGAAKLRERRPQPDLLRLVREPSLGPIEAVAVTGNQRRVR